jgi:beta-galactosidase
VDNDRGNGMGGGAGSFGKQVLPLTMWRFAHESFEARSINVQQVAAGKVTATVDGVIRDVACPYKLTWTLMGSGDILVDVMMQAPTEGSIAEVPRFGMQTTLREGFDNLSWYGRGPQETYWDRQDARVGLYSGKVKDQYFPYIKPQETGNKESVRWLKLTDANGRGLLAVGRDRLSANALHYSTEDLFCATQIENFYEYMMPQRKTITLNLDQHQRGLGGDNSWGYLPHEDFRIQYLPTWYKYRLKVLSGGEDSAALAKQTFE